MKRAVALLLIFSLLLTLGGCGLVSKEETVDIVVYMDEELSDAEAMTIGTVLNTIPEVTESKFVHRENVWAEFMEYHDDPEAFSAIDASVLRHRYEISAKTADADALAKVIEEIEGVDDVKVIEVPWWTKLRMKLKY